MSDSPVIEAVGWALVHSSWLLMIPAASLYLWSHCYPNASANSKYWVALLVLLVMPILAVAGLACSWPLSGEQRTAGASLKTKLSNQTKLSDRDVDALPASLIGAKSELVVSTPVDSEPELARTRAMASELLPPVEIAPPDAQPLSISQHATDFIQPRLPLVVAIWFVGVILFSVRALVGLQFAFRQKRIGLHAVDRQIQVSFGELRDQLGVHRSVTLMRSTLVKVPCVIGHFAPVVLLPACAITGLNAQELKAILAHELAHVRRRDYVTNIVQTCIESVFFYHPAVWYVSSLVRAEREHCCDDLAVATCQDPSSLAKALLLVDQQSSGRQLALAATDGSLLQRVRRIAGVGHRRESNRWIAGVITLLGVCVLSIVFFRAIESAVAGELAAVKESDNKAPAKVPLPKLSETWLKGVPLDKARPQRFSIDESSWAEVLLVGSVDEKTKPVYWHANGELIDPPPGFDPATLIPPPVDEHGRMLCLRQVILRMVVPTDSDPMLFIGWQNETKKTSRPINADYKQIIQRAVIEIPSDHLPITVATTSDKWESLHQQMPEDALTGGTEFNWCDVVRTSTGDIAVVTPRSPGGHFRLQLKTPGKETVTIPAASKTSPLRQSGIDELITERRGQNDWVMLFRKPDGTGEITKIDVQRRPTLRTEIRNISVYPGPRTVLQVSATGRLDPGLTLVDTNSEHQSIQDLPVLEDEKRQIQGTVSDTKGKRLANAWVGIAQESRSSGYFHSDHKLIAETRSDQAGEFKIDIQSKSTRGYSPTFLIWSIDDSGASCYARTTASKPIELKFQDVKATIRVVDSDDKPVVGAEVSLESCKLPRGFASRVPQRISSKIKLTTSEKGIVEFKGWPSEAINGLSIRSDAYGVQYMPSGRVGKWVKDGMVTLRLRPTVKILGKIAGFDPERHRGLRLAANTMVYGRDVPVFGRAEVAVNEQGGFAIAALAEGYLSWESSLLPTSKSKLQLPYRQQIKSGQFLRQSFPMLNATRVRQRLIKADTGEPAANLGLQVFWGASANRTSDSWSESIKVRTDDDGWWTALVLPGKINVRLGRPQGYSETGWSDGRVDNYGLAFDIPATDRTVVLPEESFVRRKTIEGTLTFSDGKAAQGWELYGHPVSWADVSTGGVSTDERGRFKMSYPDGYPPRVFEAKNQRWQSKYHHTTDEIYAEVVSRDPLKVQIPLPKKQ